MGCVTCGRVGAHADWCSWVNEAIREARRGERPKDWWPWWLESIPHGGPQRGPQRERPERYADRILADVERQSERNMQVAEAE